VLPAQRGDSIECDEVWAYAGSKKQQAWLWLSWSFQSTQTLSFAVGARDEATGRKMWEGIPKSYSRKQAYTDEYVVYEKLIPWWRHWVCPKRERGHLYRGGLQQLPSASGELSGQEESLVRPESGLASAPVALRFV